MTDAKAPLFDIVFRGDILPGQNLLEVKQRLGQLFKADAAKIDGLFSGSPVPLKRNLEETVAAKYVAALNKAGADVQLLAAGKLAERQARRSKPSEPRARPQQSAPVAPSAGTDQPETAPKKQTLAERLQVQEQQRLAEEAEKAAAEAAARKAEDEAMGFTLAPLGADVLKPEEREDVVPAVVDVSSLSLREAEGELLDTSERVETPVVNVDVSELSVDKVGADLLKDSERHQEPDLEFDFSDVDLAEPGSDLGQLKSAAPPPPPDTSGIRLEEP